MSKYDVLIIGHPSKDINIEHKGETRHTVGGAVTFSTYSAVACGAVTGAVIKHALEDKGNVDDLPLAPGDLYFRPSERTVSIRNTYLSADKERRLCETISIADPVIPEDIPDVEATVFQLAGLIRGDLDPDVIIELSKRGQVALDAQGMLRCVD